jgi:hypothetical protein
MGSKGISQMHESVEQTEHWVLHCLRENKVPSYFACWSPCLQTLTVCLSVEISWFRGSGLWDLIHLPVNVGIDCPGGKILSQLQTQCFVSAQDSGNGTSLLPERGEPMGGPHCLNFSVLSFPSSQPSLVAVFHLDTVAGCHKTPWALILPCFQSPRLSHSQIRSSLQNGTCYCPLR